MNVLARVSGALAVAVVLIGTSVASASPGIHWSPTFGTGSHLWTDHHGRQIEISVNFIGSTYTQQLSGPNNWHRARAVCSWFGFLYNVTGARVWGTNTSGASCGLNPNVAGRGGTGS
ncbi:MAG: hypothetical protein OXU20_26190 [Myxococcales bacterium]|nr:hypothetical protein [Myxococcales bacterium]